MLTLLVIQVIVIVLLVIIILMQSPDIDGLSGLNSSVNNNNSTFNPSNSGTILTKITYVLAALFIINTLCIMSVQSKTHAHNKEIIDKVVQAGEAPSND